MQEELIRGFSNIGLVSKARAFVGFPADQLPTRQHVAPREAAKVVLEAGDLVSLTGTGGASAFLLAVDDRGREALASLGVSAEAPVPWDGFDHQHLRGWIAAHGGTADLRGVRVPLPELVAFRAMAPTTLWVVHTISTREAVEGGYRGEVILSATGTAPRAPLPDPLGDVRDEFTVSRGTARAYEVKKGEILQIIDIDGQQCSDFMAFRKDGLDAGQELMIDSTATRSMVRHAYPGPGLLDKFFDADMRPLLRVVQDTCGRHDTFGLACTARGYEERGFPGHLNCSDNISFAMAPFGVSKRAAWPAINFFWNTWIDPHSHELLTEESHSRPGDYVAMEALEDLACVSTACPDDLDPINGWNPTDIHVRIYRPGAPIRRAVAYRVKEDAPMTISHESAFHPRTAELTQAFAPARDLWLPTHFPATGTAGEYWACREKVALQDMSSLRKYDIVGPDAERLMQRALSRDISRLAVWRGGYAIMCDETGAVIDDGTLFRMGDDLFRWCCGTEESVRHLAELADAEGLNVRVHDMNSALVNLALQGPRSRDVLTGLVFTQPHVPALEHVKWFGATIARLRDRDGAAFMLTRTGYTGELGYEIFCTPGDALTIWDALMEAGAEHGITPMGSAALDVIRIEAGLPAAGAEFGPGSDAYESGLGFAVDLKKADFVGRSALERNADAPRRALKGLIFECQDVPAHGAPVYAGERQIGQITSAARSPQREVTIAMARLAVEYADDGTKLHVGQMGGHLKRLPVTVAPLPFYDPKRTRARA
ncbi:MAG: DUF1989 domain-containing protein [Pseudomonadota bacterium]